LFVSFSGQGSISSLVKALKARYSFTENKIYGEFLMLVSKELS
jgi:hypothetical protein